MLIGLGLCFVLCNPTFAMSDGELGEPVSSILDDHWSLDKVKLRSVMSYWDDDGTVPNIITDDEDRYYTSGEAVLSDYSFDLNLSDKWIQRLAPAEKWDEPNFGFGLALKQQIFTSSEITDVPPPADDHPYSGYLYIAFSFQRSDKDKHDHFELDMGVVGERSQGESVQKAIHNVFGADEPLGWGSQLANELTINFTYERTWRSEPGNIGGLEFELLPAVGFDVGNVSIKARGRATFRFGKHLPNDFGPPTFLGHRDHTATAFGSKDDSWSIYGYTTLGVDAVAHSIFLDGNTFATSPSVEPEPIVAQITVGLIATLGCFQFGIAETWQSDTFQTQEHAQSFGSILLGWTYEY